MTDIVLNMTGYITSRQGEGGAPRETVISELNPSRRELILRHTQWDKLFFGTLNVKLDRNFADELDTLEPFFKENSVKYPDKYKSIPQKKGGYLYYNASLSGYTVLLRTTVRASGKTVGVVADRHLKDFLKLSDKSPVEITVTSPKKIIRPFFFDKKKNPIQIENLYKNAHIFLIASGPSFKNLPNKSKLRFVQTIGMNNSPKAMSPYFRPNLWTCVDSSDKFLYTLWNDPQILKLVPDSHSKKMVWNSDINLPDEKKVDDCPNVIYWRRTNIFDKKKYLSQDAACWGQNKEYVAENGVNGKRSVFIATIKILYMLGFRHVYLLGVDFNMSGGKQNYSFEQHRKKSSVNGNNSTYKQMQYWFSELQPIFLKNKFHIYNCNSDSGLTAFPYMPFDEAYQQALHFVHDPDKYINGELENTNALYETRVWKCSACNLWQRIEEKSQKDSENKEFHISITPCNKCGKILSSKDKERKG